MDERIKYIPRKVEPADSYLKMAQATAGVLGVDPNGQAVRALADVHRFSFLYLCSFVLLLHCFFIGLLS